MNRHQRRKIEAVKPPALEIFGRVNVSRPDGRPEAYDSPVGLTGATCAVCVIEGKFGVRYNHGEIFMCSPIDSSDGVAHLVCKGHLPEDIVIFDPVSGACRNRDGSDVWREDAPGISRPYVKS